MIESFIVVDSGIAGASVVDELLVVDTGISGATVVDGLMVVESGITGAAVVDGLLAVDSGISGATVVDALVVVDSEISGTAVVNGLTTVVGLVVEDLIVGSVNILYSPEVIAGSGVVEGADAVVIGRSSVLVLLVTSGDEDEAGVIVVVTPSVGCSDDALLISSVSHFSSPLSVGSLVGTLNGPSVIISVGRSSVLEVGKSFVESSATDSDGESFVEKSVTDSDGELFMESSATEVTETIAALVVIGSSVGDSGTD